jgi:hypothetical protein
MLTNQSHLLLMSLRYIYEPVPRATVSSHALKNIHIITKEGHEPIVIDPMKSEISQ